MRIAAIGATLLLLAACSTTTTGANSPFQQPNSLMAEEITRRVEQIPYQHRDELLENLLWLTQTGEQTIPTLLGGLNHENPKVRSSCAWVLGRLHDRRTIPNLQAAVKDQDQTVRMECARTLVLMGDLAMSPTLIEGLDSERKEVRYMCHEALKTATGHDFGYDHLNQNQGDMRLSVLRWRQWWSEYSGDGFFSQTYQQQHGLQVQPAAPNGETLPGNPSHESVPQVPPSESPLPLPSTTESVPLPTPPAPNGSTTPGNATNGNGSPVVPPAPAPRPNGGQ